MFKFIFGFFAGLLFSITTLILASIGAYISLGLDKEPAKKPYPSQPR